MGFELVAASMGFDISVWVCTAFVALVEVVWFFGGFSVFGVLRWPEQ